MTRERSDVLINETSVGATLVLARVPATGDMVARPASGGTNVAHAGPLPESAGHRAEPDGGLLRDASALYQNAAARGEQLSQRMLARQLRKHGHRFPNEHLRQIAESIGLSAGRAA
jgi:hypothetical protein